MEEQVYLNGITVPLSEALIPVDDRAVLYGDSCFETLRSYGGRPFLLDRHIERLAVSCSALRLALPMEKKEIAEAVMSLLEENGLDRGPDASIRITVTGGPSAGPKGLFRPNPTGIFILARPYQPPPAEHYRKGVSVVVSGIRRNPSSPLSMIKSGNYLDSLLARQEALDRGADDAILLTCQGNLSEATGSNLFAVRRGEVLTPDLGCGFLPGITREVVIELCLEAGIPVRAVTRDHRLLSESEEIFLTNSLIEVMPVRRAGSRLLKPCPGSLTIRLMDAYREMVSRETR